VCSVPSASLRISSLSCHAHALFVFHTYSYWPVSGS
jgi:hypothetical protein